MNDRIKQWLLILLAWFCLAIAALSFVIPILPTTVPVIVGLVILSTEYLWAHRLLEKLKAKYPKRVAPVIGRVQSIFGRRRPSDHENADPR